MLSKKKKKDLTMSKHYEDFGALLISASEMDIALECEEDLSSKSIWVAEKTDYLSSPFSE